MYAFLGHDSRDRSRVYAEIVLEDIAQPMTTVTHESVPSGLRLTVHGCIVDKGRQSVSRSGQIDTETLRHVVPVPGTWTHRDLLALADIWDRWHLNDMRAGCAHQTVVWEDSEYGRRPSLELTPVCPESGYKYGQAWLYEPLPADVLAKVRHLIDLPRGVVPDYVN